MELKDFTLLELVSDCANVLWLIKKTITLEHVLFICGETHSKTFEIFADLEQIRLRGARSWNLSRVSARNSLDFLY